MTNAFLIEWFALPEIDFFSYYEKFSEQEVKEGEGEWNKKR